MTPIRVVLVDDHALMRQGISTILSAQADIEVVGEASSGEEALEVVRLTEPDVVCMDVEMPGIGGLEATRRLVSDPEVTAHILMLTTFEREDYLLAALDAGASRASPAAIDLTPSTRRSGRAFFNRKPLAPASRAASR